MPIYVFRCRTCGAESEALLALGDTSARACPDCGGPMQQKFGRVGIKYATFGFTATDSLVRDPRGKDFKALRDRAEQISDT
ncbi:MAG TPA: FmdB family zinc ribbon protein [Mycobacteriales bacterium]|nr:FmdB family zinc ribbon protein [Mycobacteriales bacterium]